MPHGLIHVSPLFRTLKCDSPFELLSALLELQTRKKHQLFLFKQTCCHQSVTVIRSKETNRTNKDKQEEQGKTRDMASASSSGTPANATSQQHINPQSLDSSMRTRHVLGSIIRSSSTTRNDPSLPPNRASSQLNRASPQQSNHSHSRAQGSKGGEPTEAADPLPSCEYDQFFSHLFFDRVRRTTCRQNSDLSRH